VSYPVVSHKYPESVVRILLFILIPILPLNAKADLDPNITNAPFQVIIPAGIQVVQEELSPNANDPTTIFRITAMVSNAWFDAIAPYHPTAVGVYSRIPTRPESERNDRNRNVATLYASKQIYTSMFPQRAETFKVAFASIGLDPDDNSLDTTTPIGIGNVVGKAIVDARINDGFNELGNEGGCRYNCQPYSDYTGYIPVNTAHKLSNPSRWQPDINSSGNGIFKGQQFVTPQLAVTAPFTYRHWRQFKAPFPKNSQAHRYHLYKAQADQVLQASANLTDVQKVKSELFENKFQSVLAAAASTVQTFNLSLEQSIVIEFMTNVASFDTAIAVWRNKRRFDAVRPFSAIKYIYGDRPVTAWGGPGKGVVHDIPANQWTSYLSVANHPEYPSATASICAAHAQIMRRLLGDHMLQFSVVIPARSSSIEPGITPANDLVLNWDNWTDFENDCGLSRLWGGVHFYSSIPAGINLGHQIADISYEFIEKHLEGRPPKWSGPGKSNRPRYRPKPRKH